MARKGKRPVIYRDTVTGRFAKRSTYNRSKALGGDRYVRQTRPIVGGKIAVGNVEYVLHFDSAGIGEKRNAIQVQVHLRGPEIPDKEVLEIYQGWFATGTLPPGWQIAFIYWKHEKSGTHEWAKTPEAILAARDRLAAILGLHPTIRRSRRVAR